MTELVDVCVDQQVGLCFVLLILVLLISYLSLGLEQLGKEKVLFVVTGYVG